MVGRPLVSLAALAAGLVCLSPIESSAGPAYQPRVARAARLAARLARRANKPRVEVRGAAQEAMVREVVRHRARREHLTMKRAGLAVPYAEVRGLVNAEMQHFVRSFERPAGWAELSAGRQFGGVLRALKKGFAKEVLFPHRAMKLDSALRQELARQLAAHASPDKAPKVLARWAERLGVAAKSAGRAKSATEAWVSTLAGGSKAAPVSYEGSETKKAVENFRSSGRLVARDLIYALAEVKEAAARANMATGRLDRKRGAAIVIAAREVRSGKLDSSFRTDAIQGGAGTSTNMNVNEVIAARASQIISGRVGDSKVVHAIDHVNLAQSTNDVYPTAIRIASYRRLGEMVKSYRLLIRELRTKARQYAELPKAGRTHLQDAVPITLGAEFGAYAAVLKRDVHAALQAMRGLRTVNLGGTAVGTALNAEPAYVEKVTPLLAKITGIKLRRAKDMVDATQNTDALTRAHAVLKVSSSNLNKIANDLRLMASGPRAGLGEIMLPARQKGSSIMPGKVNPVIPEMVNQIGYRVAGNDLVVNLASSNGQFELNQMEPVLADALLESTRLLDRGAFALATRAIRGLKANEKKCRTNAAKMLGLATVLTPHIGYDRAAKLAKQAQREDRSLLEVVVESKAMSREQAKRILDPKRIAKGGVID